MKTLQFTSIVVMAVITLVSCGGGTSNEPANADGFEAIENEIKSKFGENAFYTDLTISYNKSIGNIIRCQPLQTILNP